MTSTLQRIATLELQTLLDCGYRNVSDRMVILRCCGPHSFFLERVVFPFELLSFQCPRASEVEIWTHGLGGPELLESCPAEELTCEPLAAVGSSQEGPAGSGRDPMVGEALNPWLEAG
ncbi:MAG: DUF1830 domain-containing protein [Cyanobium sp.]